MEWRRITITVVLSVFCVIDYAAMKDSEIEEFRNFLKKTSHLEETLKKGPGVHHDDDRDAVSDHAWEESGKFEGDIILNDRQRKVIVQEVAEGLSRNGLLDTTKRWPDNEVIYYIQKEHFTSDQVQAIEDGMNDLTQASCIKFRPYKKGDRDAVVIQGSRRGCFSQVGYQGGYQVLNLSGRHPVGKGCFRHGTVVHELLHTLGFYHMQSSPDRDDYIDVLWENIVEPAKHNFRKYNTFSVSDFGVGYDYDSVLHYSRAAFSRNGRDTLVPKQGGASIGQRVGLSDKDTQKLNKMYCDAGTDDSKVKDEKDERTTEKSVTTKDNAPEPKHFEGHGLGYHQGKAVVIKLTPSAAKTYKIPEFPTFDTAKYFSQAPETLSSTFNEDTETGKQLNHSQESPFTDFVSMSQYQGNEDPDFYDKNNEDKDIFENEKSVRFDEEDRDDHISYDYDQYPNNVKNKNKSESHIDIDKSESDNNTHSGRRQKSKNPKNENKRTKTGEKQSDIRSSKENNGDEYSDLFLDYNEEFERLGKIIKDHVYPSQTPNFDVYKNVDYQHDKKHNENIPNYYNYESDENNKKLDFLDKELKKTDISSILPLKDSKNLYVLSDKLPHHFSNLYDTTSKPTQDTEDKVKHISEPVNLDKGRHEDKEFDKSSYPYRDEFDTSYEYVPEKDTSLFTSGNEDKTGNTLKRGHSIIGYAVPKSYGYKRNKESSHSNHESEHPEYQIKGIPHTKSKQAFKIIGLIVPISDDVLNENFHS